MEGHHFQVLVGVQNISNINSFPLFEQRAILSINGVSTSARQATAAKTEKPKAIPSPAGHRTPGKFQAEKMKGKEAKKYTST